jgi:16S rRNA (uracil1498-N3)-methyltransferase
LQLFYTTHIADNKALLTDDEARHIKVLRKSVNDQLHLIDGTGYLYEAVITEIVETKKAHEVHFNIVSKTIQARGRNYHFHLFIAPTKQNERIEWMLEKAIETGLDSITFIQTEHSEKSRVNMGRLEKICISAMKQSGEFYKPLINDLINFKDVLHSNKDAVKLLAHCNSQFEKQSLQSYTGSIENANINIFIGPEGDFSETEIQQAYEMGFKGLSLGSTRLRTETAGLYAAIGLSAVLGK